MLTKLKHSAIALLLTGVAIVVLYLSVVLTYVLTVVAAISIIYIVLQISNKSWSHNSR
jgi:hypothetical protein